MLFRSHTSGQRLRRPPLWRQCDARRRARRRARSRPTDVSSPHFADKQAEYSLALRAVRAPDDLEGHAHAPGEESAAVGGRADETDKKPSAAVQARDLLGHLRGLGFRAYLDRGALCLADATGWRRDLFRLISPALVFEVLNAGLDDDPALLDPRENSP